MSEFPLFFKGGLRPYAEAGICAPPDKIPPGPLPRTAPLKKRGGKGFRSDTKFLNYGQHPRETLRRKRAQATDRAGGFLHQAVQGETPRDARRGDHPALGGAQPLCRSWWGAP